MFRLTLTDQQESTLSSSITQVIDNALEITRPHAIKTFKQASGAGNLINKRLDSLERQIHYKNSYALCSPV